MFKKKCNAVGRRSLVFDKREGERERNRPKQYQINEKMVMVQEQGRYVICDRDDNVM
jgi:hypothetical protein